MTDQDRPDTPDDPDDGTNAGGAPRTEGVRIIGAEEAAEAASRPDVARRRRRGEKRFGDRPDGPRDVGDLPKVRISTSDADLSVEPVAAGPEPDEPRLADDDAFAAVPDEEARRYGHARLVDERDDDAGDGEVIEVDEVVEAGGVGEGDAADWPEPSPATWEPDPLPWEDEAAAASDLSTPLPWEEGGADAGAGTFGPGSWSSIELPEEPGEDWDRGVGEPGDPGRVTSTGVNWLEDARPVGGPDVSGVAPTEGEQPFGGDPDEDSFVLPHWTEPATGQVPRVVAEDLDEPEPMTGSQPRWRDEGERAVDTDFDDLRDDGPRLGALGNDDRRGDPHDFFDDEADRDPFSAFGPEDEEPAPRQRRPAPRDRDERPPRDGGGGGAASGGGDRNLGLAVGVGVGLAAVGLLCFWLGTWATLLLAVVVVGVAAFEYFGAVQRHGYQPATLVGIAAIVGLLVATTTSGLAAYPVVLALTVVAGLVWYLWVAPGEHSVRNLGITLLGVLWIGFLGSFATLFLGLGRVLQEGDDRLTSNPGIGVIIAAVLASVSHDVGAYFVGRFYGRTSLSTASPNKTTEGLLGGFGASFLVTFVVVGLVGISPIGDGFGQAFVFALLCALVAPLGDLCESFIKRDLGIKDMGSVLPGHGGVLDRFDALLFVLPTAYFVTVLFGVWSPA